MSSAPKAPRAGLRRRTAPRRAVAIDAGGGVLRGRIRSGTVLRGIAKTLPKHADECGERYRSPSRGSEKRFGLLNRLGASDLRRCRRDRGLGTATLYPDHGRFGGIRPDVGDLPTGRPRLGSLPRPGPPARRHRPCLALASLPGTRVPACHSRPCPSPTSGGVCGLDPWSLMITVRRSYGLGGTNASRGS